MNWKLFIGQAISKADNLLIKSNSTFVNKNYPFRRNWLFDLKRKLSDATVILDVGAYIGDVSIELSEWYPMAKIFSFEPVNESFDKLHKATKELKNVSIFNVALGDKTGKTVIPLYSAASINTLKKAQYDDEAISTQQVTIVRLDDFLTQQNITDDIDILKIDVEGYELEVLKGLGRYLEKVKYIITEVGYQRSPTKTHFTDMELFMEVSGFELLNIYELMPVYNDRTKLSYSNNVYFNKNFS